MYVIDLRKNESQTQIETAIATHEGKDLWDAHPWAIKGMNQKERTERGSFSIVIATAGSSVNGTVNFAKSFTVPPLVKYTVLGVSANTATYCTLNSWGMTTTSFTIQANSGVAQTVNIAWEATGY